MAYTLENLDRVGVWYLDGPGHFAQYNFVREVSSPPPRPTVCAKDLPSPARPTVCAKDLPSPAPPPLSSVTLWLHHCEGSSLRAADAGDRAGRAIRATGRSHRNGADGTRGSQQLPQKPAPLCHLLRHHDELRKQVAADGIRWLKVSKTTFNTALISVQAVGTALRTHAQGATA